MAGPVDATRRPLSTWREPLPTATLRHAAIKSFYDEYFAIMDLSADFYLKTIHHVFQTHSLPKGSLAIDRHRVDPAAIRGLTLLTVEGERDDICGLGQTMAAQDLCSGMRPYRRWVAYPRVGDTIALAS